jgi:hypothetical protein
MAKQVAPVKSQSNAKKPSKVKEITKPDKKPVVVKKQKEQRIIKKIEDFNKFHRLRTVKEARMRKSLSDHISIEPVRMLKAVKCLQKYIKEQKEKSKFLLEDEDEFIYIEITLSKLPTEYSIRPFQM